MEKCHKWPNWGHEEKAENKVTLDGLEYIVLAMGANLTNARPKPIPPENSTDAKVN